MSEYSSVSRGALKLKTDCEVKKKKKKKEARKIFETISNASDTTTTEAELARKQIPLTNAEKAFLKMQDKKRVERILEKASKTHKQRVEDFNRHLDSLTEHYDIPKVSWTK